MMNSGCQQDMLECTTKPLPDHIHGKLRNKDEFNEELEASIQNSLTKLVSQLDADNNLGTAEVRDGICISQSHEVMWQWSRSMQIQMHHLPKMNQSISVYEFSMNNTSN